MGILMGDRARDGTSKDFTLHRCLRCGRLRELKRHRSGCVEGTTSGSGEALFAPTSHGAHPSLAMGKHHRVFRGPLAGAKPHQPGFRADTVEGLKL